MIDVSVKYGNKISQKRIAWIMLKQLSKKLKSLTKKSV